MSTIILQEALNYLDIFREYVVDNDIPTAIRGNANYLSGYLHTLRFSVAFIVVI